LNESMGIVAALKSLASGWGMESPLESARIVACWSDVVGPEMAAKCRPTSLRGGVLRIRTDSSAWASEFRFVAPKVVARINAQLGAQVVREIKPWVGPPVKDNRSKRQVGPAGREVDGAPVNAAVLSEADLLASNIRDEKVAGALRRAVVAAKISQGKGAGVVQLEDIHCAPKALSRSRIRPQGTSNEQVNFTARGRRTPRR
jgi:hypothetical protein